MIGFNYIEADYIFSVMSGYTAGNNIKNTPESVGKFFHIVTDAHKNKSFKIDHGFENAD
jgi:hypothetical protein